MYEAMPSQEVHTDAPSEVLVVGGTGIADRRSLALIRGQGWDRRHPEPHEPSEGLREELDGAKDLAELRGARRAVIVDGRDEAVDGGGDDSV
jgi:hypothetical protein